MPPDLLERSLVWSGWEAIKERARAEEQEGKEEDSTDQKVELEWKSTQSTNPELSPSGRGCGCAGACAFRSVAYFNL